MSATEGSSTTDESALYPPAGSESSRSGHTVGELREFRDAAAAAPFWRTADWTAPTTIEAAVVSQHAVAAGVLGDAELGEPEADPLVPYEGAPTLYHLRVHIGLFDEEGQPDGQVRLPVDSTGGELIDGSSPAGAAIVQATPVGARAVLVARDGHVTPVALEAGDGELVAFYESMDAAVADHTIESLSAALSEALAG